MGIHQMKQHLGILVNDFFTNHQDILNHLNIPKKGTFFWDRCQIQQMIVKAERWHACPIAQKKGQSLRSMSNGEQKKALLDHLIAQSPKILVIQDLYAHLDATSIKSVLQKLTAIAHQTQIIQMLNEEKEGLPFLKRFIHQKAPLKQPLKTFDKIPKSPTNYPNYKVIARLKNIQVSYKGKKILRDIHWDIKPNSFWELSGANGSGKTTLLSLMTGDNPKAYGQDITLFDRPKSAQTIWDIKKNIGYCTPDITTLFDRRHSVIAMLISGFFDSIGLYQKPTALQIHLAQEWLTLLGMTSLQNKTFLSLPLGKQRMILAARAMVKHPPLLFLDEPTIGLDTPQKNQIVQLIKHFATHTKSAIVYVSHQPMIDKNIAAHYQLKYQNKSGSIGMVVPSKNK